MSRNSITASQIEGIKKEAEGVLYGFQRLIFIKQLIVEVQARIHFKKGVIYSIAPIDRYLNMEDGENLLIAWGRNAVDAGRKKRDQFLEKYYTQSDADLEIVLEAAG